LCDETKLRGEPVSNQRRILGNPDEIAQPVTAREKVLFEAAKLITGDRNKTYGSPTQNFQNTADIWNVVVGHKLNQKLTATDVANLMIGLKLARMVADPQRDNFVDIAGYAGCGWETVEEAVPQPIKFAGDV
jgi:hypothetical protein